MQQMTTSQVIDGLAEVWRSILIVTDNLDEEQWRTETPCPGWDVADNLSHLIGIERAIEGEAPPFGTLSRAPHIKNDAGAMNERWVDARRTMPGNVVRAEFAEVTSRRLATLATLPESAFDEVGSSPIGQVPMRTFMMVRIMDSWLHEQDIRDALRRPGGVGGIGEAVTIDRADLALGVIVGKGAKAPEGASVAIELLDATPQRRRLEIVDGRAVRADGETATATVVMSSATYVRRFGGRISATQALAIDGTELRGDQDLAAAVVAAMAVMI